MQLKLDELLRAMQGARNALTQPGGSLRGRYCSHQGFRSGIAAMVATQPRHVAGRLMAPQLGHNVAIKEQAGVSLMPEYSILFIKPEERPTEAIERALLDGFDRAIEWTHVEALNG